MDSDSDSFYEENSDNEQKVACPLNTQVNVNRGASAESPHPGSSSPVPPAPIPVGELSPVWEMPDNGTNFLNFYTRAHVLQLKNWAQVTKNRINEEGYFVEEPMISQNLAAFLPPNYGSQWEIKLCGRRLRYFLRKYWRILRDIPG